MKIIKPSYEIIDTLNETEILKKSSYVTGCKTCVHNRKRTLKNKNCLKNHSAVYGFNCRDYESKNVNDILKAVFFGKFYN